MSGVIRAQAFQWFLLPRKSRLGQTNSDFGTSVVEIIGVTLDVKANFKSRRKMPELTITAIARKAGVRPSTLRYYEKIGLLPLPRRAAGRRRYDVCTLKQLELIAYAKRAGLSLAQIKALQESASRGNPPDRLWRDLAKGKAAELDQVIVRAQEAKRRLAALSRCRCRNLAECGDLLWNEAEERSEPCLSTRHVP
jgi:MerR family redox-sensitive transcriptional activator SoxR